MLLHYLAIAIPLLIVDAIWLGVIAGDFYARELGDLRKTPFDKVPALIFYLGYPALLLVLIVGPLTELGASWQRIGLHAALFGLAAYGTYDLVNLSTIRGWSLKLTLVDMTWGMLVTAFAALVGTWLVSR
jgi:uncharacterized membrane protein